MEGEALGEGASEEDPGLGLGHVSVRGWPAVVLSPAITNDHNPGSLRQQKTVSSLIALGARGAMIPLGASLAPFSEAKSWRAARVGILGRETAGDSLSGIVVGLSGARLLPGGSPPHQHRDSTIAQCS